MLQEGEQERDVGENKMENASEQVGVDCLNGEGITSCTDWSKATIAELLFESVSACCATQVETGLLLATTCLSVGALGNDATDLCASKKHRPLDRLVAIKAGCIFFVVFLCRLSAITPRGGGNQKRMFLHHGHQNVKRTLENQIRQFILWQSTVATTFVEHTTAATITR